MDARVTSDLLLHSQYKHGRFSFYGYSTSRNQTHLFPFVVKVGVFSDIVSDGGVNNGVAIYV